MKLKISLGDANLKKSQTTVISLVLDENRVCAMEGVTGRVTRSAPCVKTFALRRVRGEHVPLPPLLCVPPPLSWPSGLLRLGWGRKCAGAQEPAPWQGWGCLSGSHASMMAPGPQKLELGFGWRTMVQAAPVGTRVSGLCPDSCH